MTTRVRSSIYLSALFRKWENRLNSYYDGLSSLGSIAIFSIPFYLGKHIISPEYWLIPRKRWLHPGMTEKLLTGTLKPQNKQFRNNLFSHLRDLEVVFNAIELSDRTIIRLAVGGTLNPNQPTIHYQTTVRMKTQQFQ